MRENEKPHEITDREKRAWKDGAKRTKHDRPKLTTSQRIEFLKLVAQLASNSTFERRLELTPADVQYYKNQLNVESQDDARRLYKLLEIDAIEGNEKRIINETNKARSAEETANLRLKELELRRTIERREKLAEVPDGNKIRKEDTERQERFKQEQEAQIAEVLSKSEPWSLPLEGSESDRRGITDRFRRDIEHCGMRFCISKYQASSIQLKAEATRLGLRINWDRVKQ